MDRTPPTIDMMPDGSFRTGPSGPRVGWAAAAKGIEVPLGVKLGLGAAVLAVVGLSLTVAALAIYLVSLILPIVVVAGGVAWAVFRFRRWQARRGEGNTARSQTVR